MKEFQENDMTPVGLDEPLRFRCHPEVGCFNECCHDVNQFLYPYDILRLKTRLGISSSEFLSTYCLLHEGQGSGLPVASFKLDQAKNWACPFVTESGCRVYEDRPASCRMYPLARGLARDRKTGKITEHFAVIREGHCKGFCTSAETTVAALLESQGVAEYNRWNDPLIEIVSRKAMVLPGPLEGPAKEKFILGCYDLDGFRETILDTGALEGRFDAARLARARTDEVALLSISLDWVREELFGSI